MAREAGAKNVYFYSSSPPVIHPHIYGIDLASTTELIAHKRDRKSVVASVNADDMIFLPLGDLEAACAELSPRPEQKFEVGGFNGKYITPVSQDYLGKLESPRCKPKTVDSKHNSGFVTVGDTTTIHPAVSERSDIGLHNLVGDF